MLYFSHLQTGDFFYKTGKTCVGRAALKNCDGDRGKASVGERGREGKGKTVSERESKAVWEGCGGLRGVHGAHTRGRVWDECWMLPYS